MPIAKFIELVRSANAKCCLATNIVFSFVLITSLSPASSALVMKMPQVPFAQRNKSPLNFDFELWFWSLQIAAELFWSRLVKRGYFERRYLLTTCRFALHYKTQTAPSSLIPTCCGSLGTMLLIRVLSLAFLGIGSGAFRVEIRAREVGQRLKAFADAVEEEAEKGDLDEVTSGQLLLGLGDLVARMDNLASDRPRRFVFPPIIFVPTVITWIRALVEASRDEKPFRRRVPYVPPWRPLPTTTPPPPPTPPPAPFRPNQVNYEPQTPPPVFGNYRVKLKQMK